MIRTASLVTLVMALVVLVGCEKKTTDERKPDVPVTGSDGTNTKGKGKSIEAVIRYPQK